ncbi:MAG: OmpA family protein [Pseudomonadota bacterium]
MSFATRAYSVAALMSLVLAASPAMSEQLNADDVLSRLNSQRDLWKDAASGTFSATRSLAGGGTRGLQVIKATDLGISDEAQPLPDDGRTEIAVGGTGQGAADVIEAAAGAYGQFQADMRIELEINFSLDSAALAASEAEKLQVMCNALRQSDFVVRVVGHTDSRGSDAYNMQLSLLRAREVARHFVEDCGIPADRLEVMGLGEAVPANPGDPRADENRRVEFQAVG